MQCDLLNLLSDCFVTVGLQVQCLAIVMCCCLINCVVQMSCFCIAVKLMTCLAFVLRLIMSCLCNAHTNTLKAILAGTFDSGWSNDIDLQKSLSRRPVVRWGGDEAICLSIIS